MRILGIFCLLLTLGGCSSLLFYPEPGQIFTPEKAKLEYRTVTLVTACLLYTSPSPRDS